MKIIHCSDVRLNASPEMSLGQEKAEERNSEILLTFVRMVRYAVKNDVSAIMITGNLFVPGEISENEFNIVKECITGNPGIDFLYISGRHSRDEFTEAMRPFPKNFKNMSELPGGVRYEGDVVISAQDRAEDVRLSASDLNIVMHYGPINTGAWEGKYIDYLASGGSEALDEGALGNRGRYCYSGTLEGRHFPECGPRGFIRLDISGSTIEPVFVQAAKRLFLQADLYVGEEYGEELKEKIDKKISDTEASDRDIFRLRLDGRNFDRYELDEIRRIYREKFYFFCLEAPESQEELPKPEEGMKEIPRIMPLRKDEREFMDDPFSISKEEPVEEFKEEPKEEPKEETKKEPEKPVYSRPIKITRQDITELKSGISLKDEFIRIVRESAESQDDREEIIRIGLNALGGGET